MFKLVLNHHLLTSCSLLAVKIRSTNCNWKLKTTWEKSIKFKTRTQLQKLATYINWSFCSTIQKTDKGWGLFALAVMSRGLLGTGTLVKLDQNFSKLPIYTFSLNSNISNLNNPSGRSTVAQLSFWKETIKISSTEDYILPWNSDWIHFLCYVVYQDLIHGMVC